MTSSNAPNTRLLPERAILSINGSDARALLQRVITADVETLERGQCRPGALLTPQGKTMVDFLIFADGDQVLIDVHSDAADALAKRLKMYKLRAEATIERRADLHAVWSDQPDNLAEDPRLPGHAWRGIADNAPQADTGQLAALEITHGIPAFGRDYGEGDIFPTDVNLDVYGGIGWNKGCFIGQEVVSRMKRRGTIRKRSVAVRFESDAPEVGTALKAGDVTVGALMSVDGHNAVALVRVDKLEKADGEVMADDQLAQIDVPDTLKPDEAATKV
jgi:folate-binding protein YgfZ